MRPLVSVVIPVFDGESYLERALRSALGQSITDIEVIVVDDGSSDGSVSIARSLNDPRMTVLTQARGGPSRARNLGVQHARAEFVAFLDADDEWVEDKLSRQLPLAKEGCVVYSDVLFVNDETGSVMGTFGIFDRFHLPDDAFSGSILATLLAQNVIHPSTVLIARRDLERAGWFPESLSHAEDWDLWLRCAESFRFLRVSEPLVYVHLRRGSQQTAGDLTRAGARVALDAALERLRQRGPRHDAALLRAAGLGYFGSRNLDRARAVLWEVIRRRPWDWTAWKWLAASYIWPRLRSP